MTLIASKEDAEKEAMRLMEERGLHDELVLSDGTAHFIWECESPLGILYIHGEQHSLGWTVSIVGS